MFSTSALISLIALAPPRGELQPACSADAPVAFVGVRVLTMATPAVIDGATVLVQDRKIAAINPAALPPGVCRVEAKGRTLLPGLADMHAHTDASELPLFLANGVTLVREMNGSPRMLALRDSIAAGQVVGPTLLVASPLLVGAPLRFRHKVITTAEEAYRFAHEAKELGYDYLKIYDGLSREVYDAFVEASGTLGIPLDGHIPAEVGVERVLQAGQALQHIDKISFALGGHRGDTTKFAEARRLLQGRSVWMTPTLASLKAMELARTSEYAAQLARPEMSHVDSATLGWWKSLSGSGVPRVRSSLYRFEIGMLDILRKSGARFLLGTDAGNPLMVAGYSVHDELATLVSEGGFTPYEALRSATSNVGLFVGDTLRGRVLIGSPADLLLVERNPLEDLATLRSPIGVMVRGRWMERSELASSTDKP